MNISRMETRPSIIDEDFGVGCAEEHLDHVSLEIFPLDSLVQEIVRISKAGGPRLNWVDANLPISVVMRDKGGNEIDQESGEVSFRVHGGKIALIIDDQIGNSARFELGQADGLWPELAQDQP